MTSTAPASTRSLVPMAALLVLAIYRPYPIQFVGHLGVRMIDLIILLLFGSLLFIARRSIVLDRNVLTIISTLFVISWCVSLSAFVAIARDISAPSFRDMLEVFRYLSYSVFIVFGYMLGKEGLASESNTIRILTILHVSALVFGVLQKISPHEVDWLTDLYAPQRQARALFSTERLTSFFGNPNTKAIMHNLFLAGFLARMRAGLRSGWGMVGLVVLVVSCLYIIVLSGSRTGFFVSLALLSVFALRFVRHKVLLAVVAMACFYFTHDLILDFVRAHNRYLYDGISKVFAGDFESLTRSGTLYKRLIRWESVIPYFFDNPLIGSGPLRSGVGSSTDNFYVYFLVRYGLIGVSALLLFWSVVARVILDALRQREPTTTFYANFLIFQSIAILIANMTVEAQIIPQISTFFFISLGVLVGCIQRGRCADGSVSG